MVGVASGIATDRGGGGHEEPRARPGRHARDAVAAGVGIEGSDAEDGRGLAAVETVEFGHVGGQASRVDGTEPGDRFDDGREVDSSATAAMQARIPSTAASAPPRGSGSSSSRSLRRAASCSTSLRRRASRSWSSMRLRDGAGVL